MKKSHVIAPLFALVLLACLVFVACSEGEKEQSTGEPEEAELAAVTPAEDSLVIELPGADSMTVFDLLIQTHEVDYINTATGVFVRGIDSVNNSDEFFWLFSIDGDMPQIAADRYMTRDSSVVKWHFRRINK